jgi:hypothetical protein
MLRVECAHPIEGHAATAAKGMQWLLGGAGVYVQHFLEQVLELVE